MKPQALFRAAAAVVCTLVIGTPSICAGGDSPLNSRVALLNGRPTIFLNDRPELPMVYALTDVPGGRWTWEEVPSHNIRRFAEAGVRLFQVDLWLEQMLKSDGSLEITPARRQISGILKVCPDAGVFFRFHLTPPKWWVTKHPSEWVRYADTGYEEDDTSGFFRILEDDNFPVRRVSLASDLWATEAAGHLRSFLTSLAATSEGDRLAGIQVADGIYGEWHNWGFYRHEPDTSEPMTRAFRTFVKSLYGTDDRLRAAWSQPWITFDDVRPPGLDDRKTSGGIVRDPAKERWVIDYYSCMHRVVADRILYYARTVKETWPRPIITGTFYGYYFSTFNRQAAGGHLEILRVLASPYIDYLAGPQAYEPEALKPGEAYRSRSLIESIRLHGKLWLDEMDNEPTIPIARDPRHDQLLRNGIANVRRNLLFTFTKGMGLWFYDFGAGGVDLDGFRYGTRGSRGSWDHPAIMAEIRALKRLFEGRMEDPFRSDADVLYVYDTQSIYHTASLLGTDPVTGALIDYNSLNGFKAGVAFDPVHIDDLEKVDLSKYRVIVFGNVFLMNGRQRAFLRDSVARGGRTLVWFAWPGLTDGNSLDPRRISDVTGIDVVPITLAPPQTVELAFQGDSARTYRLSDAAIAPLFAIKDTAAEIYGTFARTGEAAVARKRLADATAWYVSLPAKDAEPMRQILWRSGAHVYTTNGEVVYAGSGVVGIHTNRGGMHRVTLRNGKQVTFDLPEGSTTLILDSTSGGLLRPMQ